MQYPLNSGKASRTAKSPVVRFEEIILPHQGALYRAALRLTRDPQDAEDLVQETLLRAYLRFSSFDTSCSAAAWLRAILLRLFLDMRRRHRRQPPTVSLRTEEEWTAFGRDLRREAASSLRVSSPEGAVLSGMEQAALLRAVAGLPPPLRAVLMLVDVEGMGYREAADRLAAPLNTVRSRVRRARRRLRCAFVPDCLRDHRTDPVGPKRGKRSAHGTDG